MPLEPGQPILSSTNLLKAASLIFFPSALVLGLLLSLFSFLKLQSEQTILKAHEWSHVESGEEAIAHEFEGAATDLACLANSTVLRNFLNTNEMTYQADLGQEYLTLVANSQMYDQVRFLAADGRERVRVNFQAGQPSIVPRKDLQSKGERYYFKDIFSLQQDEVFVSPLDLNIEHGQIELPHKPMIRFGTPVFDGQGQKRGIVLLNYFGQILLDHLKTAMQDSAKEHTRSSDTKSTLKPHISLTGKSMLINQEGFWLLGLKPEEEWGFMYHNDQTMAHKYPTAWQTISRQKSGQFLTPSGMFTFITIHPLQIGHISSTGSPHPFQKSDHRLETTEYHWKLVSFVPTEDFRAFNFHFLRASFILYGAILLFLLPASLYFGRQRLLTLQTEETLRRYEFIVNKSQDLMTLIDHEYRYLAVSDSFCSMHKKTRPEIIGSTVAEVWGTEVFKEDIKPYLDQCLAGELISYSAWFAMPATGTCFYDVTLAPFQDLAKDTYYGVVISRDITARKKAEEELRDAKNMWEETFDAVPDLITILDRNHSIQRVNKAMADALGLEADQCQGQTCYQAVHGLDEPHANCPHTLLLSDGEQHEAEVIDERLGGEFLVTVSPLHDATGRLTGSVHVSRDITARKRSHRQMEKLAHLNETLLREGSMVDKMQRITDGVLEIFAADFGCIWLMAPGDYCTTGCVHAEAESAASLCEDRDHCLHLVARSGPDTHLADKDYDRIPFGLYNIGRIASEEGGSYISNDICHDQRFQNHAWAKELGLQAFAGYRLLSKEDKPLGVLALFSKKIITPEENTLLATIANATSQVIHVIQSEEKLIEAHDRMQTILDNVDAMIYIIDADTHEIVMINQYGRDLFGAVEGKKCWQALQKDQDGPCPFCKAGDPPASADVDFHTRAWAIQNTINGRWYEIHDNQITWIDDRLVRLLVATDISERQESEAKLHEFASVQKILLSEVNHRVKNNLAAIISMLHMEESRVANKDATIYSETIHDLVARIHGLALVHSLLSASEWLPLKISYLCEEVAKAALHGLHHTKEIALTVADSPALIGSSQAHHLAMVINELTTNTLKYSLDNRETAHITITIDQQEDDQVTIVFHDDGPGYPAAICAGDMSQASTGLEIVQGIITSSLQGTVHFNNDNGAVSHFTFKTELDNDI